MYKVGSASCSQEAQIADKNIHDLLYYKCNINRLIAVINFVIHENIMQGRNRWSENSKTNRLYAKVKWQENNYK